MARFGPTPPDPEADDDAVRREALAYVAKRGAFWLVPLAALAALLIGLGLPWWLVVPVVAVAWAIVVFELDL